MILSFIFPPKPPPLLFLPYPFLRASLDTSGGFFFPSEQVVLTRRQKESGPRLHSTTPFLCWASWCVCVCVCTSVCCTSVDADCPPSKSAPPLTTEAVLPLPWWPSSAWATRGFLLLRFQATSFKHTRSLLTEHKGIHFSPLICFLWPLSPYRSAESLGCGAS